jgi:uroporphyrinogen-III synthase
VHVLITRPQADAEALARALEARGHQALIAPLLTIEPIPEAVPDLEGVQAIVLTSAHAVPALAGTDPGRPVFVVGEATARAARAAGCADVRPADGDSASLARLIIGQCRPAGGAILHLAGTEVRPGLAEALGAAGFGFRRQAVYRALAATRLAPPVIEAIRTGAIDAVLLFSPRSAAVLVELIARHDLGGCLGQTEAICLSAAVAAACRCLSWKALRIATHPEVEVVLRQLEGGEGRC